ncbi:hypothetical protein [Synechococcus sp. GFB01]|uniref:hypothetical protein n=1 Tax=Synechococcus sp. GFB01 TaxID=1662190 RepID=UPI00191015DB|nr:hypothetical protein [Synechococcus sp. GFB01]
MLELQLELLLTLLQLLDLVGARPGLAGRQQEAGGGRREAGGRRPAEAWRREGEVSEAMPDRPIRSNS